MATVREVSCMRLPFGRLRRHASPWHCALLQKDGTSRQIVRTKLTSFVRFVSSHVPMTVQRSKSGPWQCSRCRARLLFTARVRAFDALTDKRSARSARPCRSSARRRTRRAGTRRRRRNVVQTAVRVGLGVAGVARAAGRAREAVAVAARALAKTFGVADVAVAAERVVRARRQAACARPARADRARALGSTVLVVEALRPNTAARRRRLARRHAQRDPTALAVDAALAVAAAAATLAHLDAGAGQAIARHGHACRRPHRPHPSCPCRRPSCLRPHRICPPRSSLPSRC